MPVVYVTEQGARLSIEKRRLLVSQQGECLHKLPLIHISSLMLYGNITITTPAMKRLLSSGIDVVFFSQYGQYQGRLIGPFSKFGMLRQMQYALIQHEHQRLPIAQRIVASKIRNMRTILARYARRTGRDITVEIEQLDSLIARAGRTQRINSLMGVEGRASAIYFQTWRTFLKHDWAFDARRRRPPTDPVNVLLSYGYTLLTHAVESIVTGVGLDPYLGVLHEVNYGRPSLALDLVEEFRAVIVDAIVMRVLNNEIITAADFGPPDPDDTRGYPLVLSDGGRKRFLTAYEQRLATEVRHPQTQETLDYRRVMERQVRLLVRTFRDGSPYVPFEVR